MIDYVKRCPFCGANPHRGLTKKQYDQLHGEPYQHEIISCPHMCASVTGPYAIDKWNTRADLTMPTPLTTAQIMADPRVRALVDALEMIQRETARCRGDQSYRDTCKMAFSTSSTALAQLKEPTNDGN